MGQEQSKNLMPPKMPNNISGRSKPSDSLGHEKATVGGGCFWCTEAVFQRLNGVISVESGYAGGDKPNPTYKEVCSGTTGHAEVVQITYDPKITSYEEILTIFFTTHDPTTLNKQGNDVGTQYRSVIFYHNETQKDIAEKVKNHLEKIKHFKSPIVTEISPIKNYTVAEQKHQNFYNDNPSNSYCRVMIKPKIDKFQKMFGDKAQKAK